MISSAIALSANPSQANTGLGVVRSQDNTNSWQQIISRLQNNGVTYRDIDINQINSPADLQGITVLFLPNVENISPQQFKAIDAWVKQGGRVIASGQVGKTSTPDVKQGLRGLLGAYWAFALNQPTMIEPKKRCLDIACRQSTNWVPPTDQNSSIQGGVLIPSGLNSSTAATWSGSSGSSAVIVTPQAVYLGWQWGNDTTANIDGQWLQATLQHYRTIPATTIANTAPTNNALQIRGVPQTNPAYNVSIPSNLSNNFSNNLAINSPNNSQNNINNLSTNPLQVANSNTQNSMQNTRINNPLGPTVLPTAPSTNQLPNNALTVGNNRNDNLLTVNSNVNPTATNPSINNLTNSTVTNHQPARKTNQSQANVLVVPVNQPNNPNNLRVTSSINAGNLQTTKTTVSNPPRQVTPQPSKTVNTANTVALNPPINQATSRLNNQLNRQISPDLTKDDSSESAPAAVNITESNQPITPGELYVMTQELTSLLGRFHNSLIASQSAHFADGLTATNDPDNLVASSDRTTTFISNNVANKSIPSTEKADQAIAQARQTLNELPNLVRSHQYATARQQWLTARQNLWQNYPIEGKRLGSEIRAVWLDRGTIVRARSERGLAMVFDRLASAGINTVFFETLNAGYTVYPSSVAPAQNPLTVGWDPLASAVKLAKERNMELHAWIWVFATGNKHHNIVTKQPEDYLGPVLTAHPTWANLDNQARIRHVNDGKVYLDPANPQVRNYLLRIIDEITTRYQVDGLQLDYIRYPFQDANRNFTFGYGIAARQQFHQLFGVDPIKLTPKDQLWGKWTEFKTQQVTSFVGEVSQLIKRKHPNVILSAAVFPHPRYERLGKIQQDWEAWTKAGYIDLLTPMTYALDTNRLNELTAPLPNSLGQSLLAPAVKLLNIPEIVAIDQIQALRDLPTTGYSLFAAERITSGIHNFLARTQGDNTGNNTRQASLNTLMGNSQTVAGTIPYRQPFVSAQERFNAIQQEWSYLITRQQFWLDKNEVEKLRTKSDRLATVLQQLASKPNTPDLTEAKKLLGELRSQFHRYTGKSQLPEHSYQANSWKNRLEAVERILIYGENLK
jgi:uncharacterized lipoprotein YddW (UPF0748 family)